MGLRFENGYYWPDRPLKYGRYISSLSSLEKALTFVKDFKTVIQAGGHCGVWPKRLAQSFDAVYTFEPSLENFKALMANINEDNVFPARGVLGASPHFIGLHYNENNTGGHWVEGNGLIPTYTIDQFHFSSCGLIALDVEGQELYALQGAIRTIEAYRPIILFEDNGNAQFKGGYEPIEIYDLLLSIKYKELCVCGSDRIWGPA